MADVEKVIKQLNQLKRCTIELCDINCKHILQGAECVCGFDVSAEDVLDNAIQTIKDLQEDCNRYHEWGFHEGYEEAKEKMNEDVCEWTLIDENFNAYDTSCRNPWCLEIGTPRDNEMNYCPYCGKKIKVVE